MHIYILTERGEGEITTGNVGFLALVPAAYDNIRIRLGCRNQLW